MARRRRFRAILERGLVRVGGSLRVAPFLGGLGRKSGFTPLGIAAILGAVLVWGAGYVVVGKLLYLVAYGAVLLIGAAYVGGRRTLPLAGRRSEVRARAREGEVLTIALTLHAKRRLSTIVLEEKIPDRLGVDVRLPIATLHSGEDIAHSYRLHCKGRGAYRVGPLVARWGDPIGLTQREMTLVPSFELLVHPNIEPVSSRPLTRQFEDPPIRPPVSKPWPSGLEFYGMREFSSGDDLRRIVWRAYAKTGTLMVRQAEQGITDQITIILDTNRRFHSGGDPSDSFEEGVRVAASLGVKHLAQGYSVTIETNEGPLTRKIRGPAAAMQLLDACARVGTGRASLSEVFGRLALDPRRDAHTVLVTPRLHAEEAAQLRLLVAKGVSVLVVALIWDEEAEQTLNIAAALGCQVVEVRPGQSVAAALAREVGAGRR